MYNVFRGFEIIPNPGASCGLLLDHHNLVLCGNDPEKIKYSLSWWASVVQRPEQKIGVSVCYRGGQGVSIAARTCMHVPTACPLKGAVRSMPTARPWAAQGGSALHAMFAGWKRSFH